MFCLQSTLSRVGDELTQVKLENDTLRNEVESLQDDLNEVTDKLLEKSAESVGRVYSIEGHIETLMTETTNPEVQAMLKRVLSFVKTV